VLPIVAQVASISLRRRAQHATTLVTLIPNATLPYHPTLFGANLGKPGADGRHHTGDMIHSPLQALSPWSSVMFREKNYDSPR